MFLKRTNYSYFILADAINFLAKRNSYADGFHGAVLTRADNVISRPYRFIFTHTDVIPSSPHVTIHAVKPALTPEVFVTADLDRMRRKWDVRTDDYCRTQQNH